MSRLSAIGELSAGRVPLLAVLIADAAGDDEQTQRRRVPLLTGGLLATLWAYSIYPQRAGG